MRSQFFTVDKARRLIGYDPQHTASETVLDSVRWLIGNSRVEVASPLVL